MPNKCAVKIGSYYIKHYEKIHVITMERSDRSHLKPVILSPSPVILSAAKNLTGSRAGSAKNLEILRLRLRMTK